MASTNNIAEEIETYTDMLTLPDLSVLSTPEVEIPTLPMDPDQLNGISLSGIINQFINVPQEQQGVTNPAEQNNIVYHITPLNDMMQQISNTDFILQQEQPQRPYIKILEQPKSNSLRFRYQCEG